jgi:hypothetical protein
MPYIEQELRPKIDEHIDPLGASINTPGELAYAITRLCKLFTITKPESFARHNTIIGVLENTKLEYYLSDLGPYESQKLLDNGGIFDEPSSGGRGGPSIGDEVEGSVATSPRVVRTTYLGGAR